MIVWQSYTYAWSLKSPWYHGPKCVLQLKHHENCNVIKLRVFRHFFTTVQLSTHFFINKTVLHIDINIYKKYNNKNNTIINCLTVLRASYSLKSQCHSPAFLLQIKLFLKTSWLLCIWMCLWKGCIIMI